MFRKAPRPAAPAPAKGQGGGPAVTVTDAAPCRKAVKLHVGLEVIAPIRVTVLGEVRKEAMLAGYRKGKAPAELIEKQFAKSIQDETLHRAMKQALEQATKDHALKPVGPFEVSRANFSESDGLSIEATVEVEPSFTLAGYQGLALSRPASEVTAEDVEHALTQLRESMAQLVPVTEPGTPPEGGVGEGNPDAVGGGTTPPTKKQRKVPVLDDELAKDLGFEGVPKLREHVEAKLREQKKAAQNHALEGALCDALLARHAFQVPASMVAHQTERLTGEFKVRLALSGTPEEKLAEETAKFTEQLRTNAERYVKLHFILDRIAEQEAIDVTQDELVGKLWELAQRWRKDPAEVRKTLDAQGLWGSIVSAIRQEKTVARVLSTAMISEAVGSAPAAPIPPTISQERAQQTAHGTAQAKGGSA